MSVTTFLKKNNLKLWFKLRKNGFGYIAGIVAFGSAIVGVLQYTQTFHLDVSGKWQLDLTIESTSYTPYKDLDVRYILYLQQNGKVIKGKGEKWLVNNKEIPFSAHTRIEMEGTILENKVYLSFELFGANRVTVGELDLRFNPDKNKMTGTFSTTGADSSGPAIAIKTISLAPSND